MLISIPSFTGVVPKRSNTQLPNNAAQEAVDCDFTAGELASIRGTVDVGSPGGLSGYVYAHKDGRKIIYHAPYEGQFVRSPVLQDDHNRIYWTGVNGSESAFLFFLADENQHGGVPSAVYRVGVASFPFRSILMDGSAGSIGSVKLVPRPPTVSASTLVPGGAGSKIVLVNESGEILKDITGDLVDFFGVGTPINGWHSEYEMTLSSSLSSYGAVTVDLETYRVASFKSTVEGTSTIEQSGRVWYLVVTSAGKEVLVPKFFKFDKEANIQRSIESTANEDRYTQYTPLAVGSTANLVIGESRVAMFYLGAGEFSADNAAIPTSLKSSTKTSGEVKASDSFSSRVEVRLVAEENGTKYEAVFPLGERVRNIWNPNYMINAELQPSAASDKKLILKLSWGDTEAPSEYRAYIMTVVNQLGEESGPIPPFEIEVPNSAVVPAFHVNVDAAVAKLLAALAGRYPAHGLRFYRASGAGGSTDYFYAGTLKFSPTLADLSGEIYLSITSSDNGVFVIPDTSTEQTLGEACSTMDLVTDISEVDRLRGVTTLYNGILAAHKGNELWLSESYKPWAWKRANIHTLPVPILDILPAEQGAYVLTEGDPYYMSGATPDTMVPTKVVGGFPSVGSGACALVNGVAMYLSHDGPVTLSGAQAQLQTTVWSREAWRDKVSDTGAASARLRMTAYGNRLLIWRTGSHPLAFLYDVSDEAWSYLSEPIAYAFPVPAYTVSGQREDGLAVYSGSGNWKLFGHNPETGAPFFWHSKDFTLPKPVNMAVLQLFGSGTVQAKVYADEVQCFSATLTLSSTGVIARLPSGFLASTWSLSLENTSGLAVVTSAVLATSMAELRDV